MYVHGLDHFHISGRMLLPVTVRLTVWRAASEVVNIGVHPILERYVRPAHAAPAEIHDHHRLDAGTLSDIKDNWDLVRRKRPLVNYHDLLLRHVVIVPD